MTNLPEPPEYIKLPVAIASADVPDGLIVTMARILSLCWAQGYRESPAYAPEELAECLGRPRSTIYRHLNKLKALDILEEIGTGSGPSPPQKSYRIRFGNLSQAWTYPEIHTEAAMETYRKTVDHIQSIVDGMNE